ncbi:unnamed protein product [Schistocephalus solidus]|uniref:Uncharacterized protein n=1 Tax=Schistocephalus solidus TaxID=70667 RepID=A0A183SG69_SCHSO|nr:unnamed protein product [Schistocephalus solidus]
MYTKNASEPSQHLDVELHSTLHNHQAPENKAERPNATAAILCSCLSDLLEKLGDYSEGKWPNMQQQ